MATIAALIAWLESSDLADAIRENDVLFPLIESIHVLAVCLFVGSIVVVDLRLLGLASLERPVPSITRAILPVTWASFVVAVTAGALMFMSNAALYLQNGLFVTKLTLIAAAGVNMLVFHLLNQRAPACARVSGGLSLLLWITIVACGRWVGFTMPT